MSAELVIGQSGPVVTGFAFDGSDHSSISVFVEGLASEIEENIPSKGDEDCEYLTPYGDFVVESVHLDPPEDGLTKMTIHGVLYGSTAATTLPERTTWKIYMQEVTHDLKMHPDVVGARSIIEAWLATDPEDRYDENGDPQYKDSNGSMIPVNDQSAQKYINAYEHGIETYVEHLPVVEKISFYKVIPGVSMSGNSVTSGTAKFSGGTIDHFDVPDVKLQGYADTGWFKGGDDYVQREDLIFVRTEQWTWTPNGSDSDLAWIYHGSGPAQGGNS